MLPVLLGPLFPMRVDIPQVAFLLLPVVAITIGVLASLAGLRRAVTVDPALAFEAPDLMGDLRIKDLVVELRQRPGIGAADQRPQSGRLGGIPGDPAGAQRLRKDDPLSCLGGILAAQRRRIEFGDIDITNWTRAHSRTIGATPSVIVFQAFNLVPSLTAIENVMVPMRAARIGRHEARERAAELLTRVGLSNRMTHRPGDLSERSAAAGGGRPGHRPRPATLDRR